MNERSPVPGSDPDVGSIERWVETARGPGGPYLEFLRVAALSSGVYVLPVGGVDRQSPHLEDEVYFVVRGKAQFAHRGAERSVGPGDLLYVPAREPHRFHSIEEELVLLVVFAPPESPPAPTT